MKGKKHNPEQIIKKLREADTMIATGKTIGQVVLGCPRFVYQGL
jgi:putative transposase